MRQVVDAVADRAAERWGAGGLRAGRRRLAPGAPRPGPLHPGRGPGRPVRPTRPRRTPSAPASSAARQRGRRCRLRGRLAEAGVTDGLQIATRKPEWLRVPLRTGPEYRRLKRVMRRPRPGHGVRGGGLPQHLRVLERRHGHVHDQRRALHPGVRLLPGRHVASPCPLDPDEPARVAEAVAALGLRYAVVTAVARDDLRRRRRRRVRRHDRPRSAPGPRLPGRGAHPRLQGRRGAARADLRGPARRAQPQHRDRRPAATRGAALRLLRPLAGGAGPGQGRRASPPRARSSWAWARPTTRWSRRWPTCGRSAPTSSRSASTCGPPPTTCRSPAGCRPQQFEAWAEAGRGAGHRPRRGQPLDPLLLPRPPGRVRRRRTVRARPPPVGPRRRDRHWGRAGIGPLIRYGRLNAGSATLAPWARRCRRSTPP